MINQYLLDYVGKTATEKILNDAKKFVLENKVKELGFNPRPNLISLVHTEDKKKILSIGASIPNDLITDQFGILLAQLFRTPSTTAQQVISLKGTDGVTNTFKPYWFGDVNAGNTDWAGMLVQLAGGVSSGIQIGQGTTLAARTDFDIETPFANGGLEDSRFGIQVPIYNIALSRCNFSNSIISTGAGSITETALLNIYMRDLPRSIKTLCMARDNISPSVDFVAAQSIFVEYVLQF